MTTGLEMNLYFDAAGMGQGTWTECGDVGDVNVPHAANKSKRKVRKNKYERTTMGQFVTQVTFSLVYTKSDPIFEMLRDAHLNKSIIGVAAMTGPIDEAGSEGMQYDCHVTDFPMNQPLEEDSMIDIVVEPAAGATDDPAWVEISV